MHVLDRDAAEILTGDPDLADTELPLETVIQRLHPDDRATFLAAVERAERESGVVVVEYRVQTPEGTRWLLDHGRTYPATAGMPAHGHGVLIDVTHQKLQAVEPVHQPAQARAPLDRAAEHAIATREAIDADGSASLRLLIDMVLLEIGRVIARRVAKDRATGLN
ncbi:PAS domain-containing protein [Methylobacterium planeticum]|uniref:PAS domain-containing protein n=1 Tax=Methylobacterium planeticum TaxID=2615211 RepID=UPI0017840110|nr:PAS domain-containing protein [Methylobacterium planeticum]